MKTSALLLISLSAAALITLNSNSSGPANAGNGNMTGGPGAAGNCASCHGGAGGTTTMNITLRKKFDNSPVSGQYNPGATYIVKVSGSHPALTGFGFQIMATKSNNMQAGTFSNLGTNYHAKTQSGVTLVEHHQVLNKTGSEFVAEFDWIAPAAGAGNVSFYGVLNAVNKNGATSGDAPSPSFNMTLAESTLSIASVTQPTIRLYPNPTTDVLRVSFSTEVSGDCNYAIYNLEGKKLIETNAMVNNSEVSIPTQQLSNGVYFLRVTNGSEITTIPFAKQ